MKKIFLFIMAMALMKSTLFAQVPDFVQTDCNGVTHHLYDELAAGKAVILDFSAGWCMPCYQTGPKLDKVYADYCFGKANVVQYLMFFEGGAPGFESDCTMGSNFALKTGIHFPVLTNIGSRFDDGAPWHRFRTEYGIYAYPTFLIIIPDKDDPSNSTVHKIEGDQPNLVDDIEDILITNGFLPGGALDPLAITVTGDLCSGEPYSATLSSNRPDGNLWSTGETTQSITIQTSGTYSLSANIPGCGNITLNKYIEFTPPVTAGIATIASNTVCLGTNFTIDYAVPDGFTGTSIWEFAYADQPDYWYGLADASYGPFSLSTTEFLWTGAQALFRVKSFYGTEASSCFSYSNELLLTVTDPTPPATAGVATISIEKVCGGSPYELSYSGNETGASWEYYSDYYGEWKFIADANKGPVALDAVYPGSFVDGFPGDIFRVRVPDVECDKISNKVAIAYTDPRPVISELCIGSGSIDLSVADEGIDTYSDIIWNPGGETTESITVTPTVKTLYTVSVINFYGCTASNSKWVEVSPPSVPKIISSVTGPVCPNSPVTLSFTGAISIAPCTNDVFGQWPAEPFSFSDCDTYLELVTDEGYAGEYSVINVEAGKLYVFLSFDPDDLFNYSYLGDEITITDIKGTTVYSTGRNYAYYIASITGQVRFYTHEAGCTANDNTVRERWAMCLSNPDEWGLFSWAPGGATTHAITVNPGITTRYSLSFTNADILFGLSGCEGTASKEVQVADCKTWYRDKDKDGYGNPDPALIKIQVARPNGYIDNNLDCKDWDNTIYPGAPELEDGQDNDCDGEVDEELDCRKLWYLDGDNDGFGRSTTTRWSCVKPDHYVLDGGDCNDRDASMFPGRPELEDGKDNDCDGVVDNGLDCLKPWYLDGDADGFGRNTTTTIRMSCTQPNSSYVDKGGDCKDNDATVYPGAHERCDGKDNDCDGQKDEACSDLLTVTENGKPANATQPLAMAEETVPEVSLWPNPARDEIRVALNGFEKGKKIDLTLMQADGKPMLAQSTLYTLQGQQVQMDVRRLSSGYYLLKVNQGALQQTKKVMIIR